MQNIHTRAQDPASMSEAQDFQGIQPIKTVTFDEEASRQQSVLESEFLPSSRRWIPAFKRRTPHLNRHPTESRAFHHAYVFRRPRALQFYNPEISGSTTPLETLLSREPSRVTKEPSSISKETSNISNGSRTYSEEGERSTDNGVKQYERVDLFIDLIWVGIIANLSGTFGEQAFGEDTGVTIGQAAGEFILLFIPIWRMWDYLREYIGNFYKDDFTDRQFLIWILLLSVLYGVNAPFAFNPVGEANSLKLLIATYLIARASFLGAYLVQCIFMPFLRRQFAFQLFSALVTSSLWVAAIFVPYPGKIPLLILANGLEQPLAAYFASPLGDKLITGGWKRSENVDRAIVRHEGFFTIILGEGVFRLIEGSPSGMGLNSHTGTVLTAVLLYYILHWLYFNGDQTKEYVHAVRRTWWKPFLWRLLHLGMFASLLILAASVLFLVKNDTTQASQENHVTRYAIWSASTSLAIVMFSMTCIALLNRALDKPRTLVINSRWIRVAPRIPAIVVIMCLPLVENLAGQTWCGAVSFTLWLVFLWEMITGLEKGWKFFEPKDEE